MRVLALGALLVAAPWATGCTELASGGLTGEATVTVSGDASESGSSESTSMTFASVLEPAATPGARSRPEGEVEVSIGASLVASDGSVEELTPGVVQTRVDIQGGSEDELVTRTVGVGSYPRVRLVFRDILADVRAGLVIGGQSVQGPVHVQLDGDSLVVERSVDVEVDEDSRVEILIDLNSTQWLNAAQPALMRVAQAQFLAAVKIRVR